MPAAAGCFSWCPLRRPWRSKELIIETDDELSKIPLETVPEIYDSSVKGHAIETRSRKVRQSIDVPQKSSGKGTRATVPTTEQYVMASGREVLTILKSAAGVIPVPLLQEAIGVALKIIEVCEEGSAAERKVKELQDRVGHLMIVVVENFTKSEEDGEEVNVKAAKTIEDDIQGLLGTLGTIKRDLTEISEQNRWVLALYKELNHSTLEACMNRLSFALEKFKLANDLRDSDLLQELHNRLGKMSSEVIDVSRDMQHVVSKVDNIDEKLDEFHVLLRNSKQSATMLPSSAVVRQQMPLKPEVFHGRDSLVEEIVQLLMKEETSRVCILGPGGMGKTSVSLAIVESSLVQERFSHWRPVWVPCIGATSAAALLETLYVQLQIPGDKQVTLERILSELKTSKGPRLIVFDNFETPWNAPGETQKPVGDILRQLAQLDHIAMLVTMRGSYPPCDKAIKWQTKKIKPTDGEACFRIFHEINPSSKDDLDVGRLLSSLGYMPFAVTLMANLGKEVHWTAKDLLDAWLECGPDMFSDNPEESMNRSISLSVDSDLVKQNPNAILLLSILSLLPAGTTSKNLRWWAPTLKKSMIPSAIATLSKAALLVENEQQGSDPILFVIPVVQSFMKQHDRISDELRKQIHLSCCQYVLEHACRYDDPAFHVKAKALAAEDTNIHSILFDSPVMQDQYLSDRTMEALIAFCWHRCDTKPSLEIVEHAVAVANAFGVERYMAITTWCLGKTHHQIANYRLAYEHHLKAYPLFDPSAADHKLRQFGCECGNDLVDAARFVIPRDEVVLLAREVETKSATLSNDVIHGRSLLYIGLSLQEAQRRQEALVYLERARDMLAAVGSAHHLANAYQVITRVQYYEKRLPEALEAIQEGWRLAELSDMPFFQAFIAVDFGMVLYSLDRDAEAWKQIEIALMRASYVGDQHSVALALDYIGYGYLRRGDHRNALSAYEAAVGKFFGTRETKSEEFCKENIAKIRKKQRTPEEIIAFRRPGLDNDDSLFYPPVLAQL